MEINEAGKCLSLVITKVSIALSALQTAHDTDIMGAIILPLLFFGVNHVVLFEEAIILQAFEETEIYSNLRIMTFKSNYKLTR